MFEKVLVANRGEIAIRGCPHAARDGHRLGGRVLGGRPRRPHVRFADEAFLLGPATPAESYLNIEKIIEAAKQAGAEAIHPGYGFLAENAAFADGLREGRDRLHRPARERDRGDGLEDPRPRADAEGRRADRPRRDRASPDVAAAKKVAKEIGYPVACKAAGGGGGKGFPRGDERGRARGGLRGRRARGREVLLRPDRLPRALPRGPAPRRGAGARRLARQRDPPRRARLLDPAPPPEADRGGARPARRRGDARADRQDRHRRRGGGRLPRRRHGRGHAGRRRLLLPRDEHPRPGRALRDRDGHRHRHRPRAGADRRRRGRSRSPRRTSSFAATRSSAASTPRPPTRTSRPRRARSTATASPPAPASGSTPASRPARR